MRRVYLTRDKSFVGCAVTLNVYVEDNARGDATVNGVAYRKVCPIKNGETVSFDIGDEATRVMVAVTTAVDNTLSDYYQIPAGETDVELGGVCKYVNGAGSPFRFHGVTDEDVLSNRKRAGKKSALLWVAAVLIGLGIGILLNFNTIFERPKTFMVEGEFEITLTSAFAEDYDENGYYFARTDCSLSVYAFGIGELGEAEFYDYFKTEGYFSDDSALSREGELWVVEETAESVDGETRKYFTAYFRDGEYYYLFEFGCMPAKYEGLRPQFIEWANTIIIK